MKNRIFRYFFWVAYGLIAVSLIVVLYIFGRVFNLYFVNPLYVATVFILAKIAAIFIHELMHALVYKIRGLKIRIFAVKGIIFYFKNNHYKISFKPEMIIKGNMVTPMLVEPMDSDVGYYNFKKTFTYSLIAGPVGSLLFLPIFIVLIIWGNAYLKIFSFWIIVFLTIQLITSLFVGKSNIGDIKTAKICASDMNMLEVLLRDYELIRTDTIQAEIEYIVKKLKKQICCNLEKSKQLETNSALIVYLNYEVVNALLFKKTVSEEIEEYLEYFIEKYTKYAYVDIDEDGIILLIHILYYYKYHAIPTWINIEEKINNYIIEFLGTEIKEYYLKQMKYICYGEGDMFYLLNENNIKCNSNWKINLLVGSGINTREKQITQLFADKIK